MGSDERLSLAEAIMWDYELDFMPEGMEIVDREDLLMWKRATGPFAQRRWSNRVSYVRTTSDQVDRSIDEVFAFFGPVAFTWVVGPTSRPLDEATALLGLRLAHPDADADEMAVLLRDRLAYLRHPVAVAGTSSLFSTAKLSPTRATATPQITRPCT